MFAIELSVLDDLAIVFVRTRTKFRDTKLAGRYDLLPGCTSFNVSIGSSDVLARLEVNLI